MRLDQTMIILGILLVLPSLTCGGQEVSERFHWISTPVCESDDIGNSQVLREDWKLIE